MVNGKHGDDPLTDLTIHGEHTFPTDIEKLARAPQGSPSTRAEQKHRACGDTQQSKSGKRNLSRDGSAK